MPKVISFSSEFERKIEEDIRKNQLGYRETARKYGLPDHEVKRKWKWIYLIEGAQGLYSDQRGRKNTGHS